MKKRIVLIGPGRLGQAVTRLLNEAGHDIRAIISRKASRAQAAARFCNCWHTGTTDLEKAREGEIVLLALPDDHLGAMAAHLRRSGLLSPGSVLVHFSGIHPASILLGEEGPSVQALAIHPLQTFADSVMGVQNIPGSPFSIEGPEELIPLAEQLVKDMEGVPFRITSQQKPLYHAAACIASNYLVTLVDTAAQVMAGCGMEKREAFELLIPILRGTGRNLIALGPEQALTGPIARGDVRTVAKHLKSLKVMPEQLESIYRLMGKQTVEVARAKGTLDEPQAKEIIELLDRSTVREH